MRLSYNWLKELVPELPASPEEVALKLTMHSFETDVVDTMALPSGVTTMKITKLAPHPDADRLRLATVTDGEADVTVICGAPNIAEGQVVPYSPPGTVLQDEAGNDFTIKEATIRGVTSPGMLNSLRELGLHTSHDGIWILPDDTPLGSELAELIPADTILEADITPNRAHDCMSHLGVARELAALYELEVAEPEVSAINAPALAGWQLTREDEHDVPLYYGSLLENITVNLAPLWMQARLLATGSRPLNNVVDITNYVMFEQGNPTHTFDASKLPEPSMTARRARAGERITLLDETDYELHSEDIVVASGDTPVILGGVMGGAATQVDGDTTSVFLEVANFQAFAVQQTSARVPLITEGSKRWVKQVPLALAENTSRRTIQLLQEHAGATVVGTLSQAPELTPRVIDFDPRRVSQLAGTDISPDVSRALLERLRCQVEEEADVWTVTVPADRLDLTAEHDLVEEVIRLYGLENIPVTELSVASRPLPASPYWGEVIRDTLAELGLSETMNYAFAPDHFIAVAGQQDRPHVQLVNPQAPELAQLRSSLLPGLLKNLQTNREHFQREGAKERALFEIGNVYAPGDGGQVPGVQEQTMVAGVLVGSQPGLPDIAAALQAALGIDSVSLENVVTESMKTALKYRLPVTGFEVPLAELVQAATHQVPKPRSLSDLAGEGPNATQFTPLPKYPSAYRDLSVIVAAGTTVEQVQEIIERVGGQLVADVDLFDEYQPSPEASAGAATANKSLSFHIEYRSDDKTLEADEVGSLHNGIVETLKKELAAELRE